MSNPNEQSTDTTTRETGQDAGQPIAPPPGQITTTEPEPASQGTNNARVSWAISMSSLRANIAHCRDEVRRVIPEAFLFCLPQNITRNEFAAQVEKTGIKHLGDKFTFSSNLVYQFVRGDYRNPTSKERLDLSEKHLKAIQIWLKSLRAHRAQALKEKDFVITPTAKRIFLAVDYARESRTPVILSGPSHIGKTWALQYKHITENHGATPYVRLDAVGGLNGMLLAICRAVGQSEETSFVKIRKQLFTALDKDMVPIIDEVHLLLNTYRRESFFSCIEMLREIYDRVGCGMVLALTNLGREKFEKERTRELQQIFRRGVHRIQLPDAPTTEDVRMILEHNGLDMPKRGDRVVVKRESEEPWAVLRQLARTEGLKAITERIRYGRKTAEREGVELSWEHFVNAHFIIRNNNTAPTTGWGSDDNA